MEEDPFARQWMSLILTRDWRTTVIAEMACCDKQSLAGINKSNRIDFVLLDADLATPENIKNIRTGLEKTTQLKILVVGNIASAQVWDWIAEEPSVVGYIIKSEIHFSLAWAVDFGSGSHWVITPGVAELALNSEVANRKQLIILDGRKTISKLTDHEVEVARLALVFSMERRDFSREFNITYDWGNGLVSQLYTKIGLQEVLSGDISPEAFVGDHPIILGRIKEIIKEIGSSKKARDMESLAFHIITMPDVSF